MNDITNYGRYCVERFMDNSKKSTKSKEYKKLLKDSYIGKLKI